MHDDYLVANEFEARLRRIFAPGDNLGYVEWLEAHQREIPYSPLRGPWRVTNSPWARKPLASVADPQIRQVLLLAAVQMAKSQILELALNCLIAKEPGPTLALQDKDENALDWMKTRLLPLWENCAPVWDLYPKDEKKRSNSSVQFPTMQLWVLGARNLRNLQRRSCKNVVGDEVWQWPQGHLREAKARLTAFKNFGKAVFAAQGGWEGDDWHKEWEESTQEEWGYHCPKCGTPQEFSRDRLEFRGAQRSDGEWDFSALPKETHMKCANPSCSHCIADTDASRYEMNESGIYLQKNFEHRAWHVGYRWNKLAGHPWAGIAEDIIRARRAADHGDDESRRQIAQKVFAQFWSDDPDDETHAARTGGYLSTDAWSEEAWIVGGRVVSPTQLESRRYANGSEIGEADHALRIPFRGLTIDAQRGSFFYVARSWSQDAKSRKRAHGEVRNWEDLDRVVAEHGVHRTMVWVDCGDADEDFWVQMKKRGWRALRGDRRTDFVWTTLDREGKRVNTFKPYSPPNKFGNSYLHGVVVHYWSNLVFKDRLNRQRRLGLNTVGDDTDPDYHAQMESEFRRKDKKTNQFVWTQRGNRANHLWDCEAMQYIMPFALGLFKYERVAPSLKTSPSDAPLEAVDEEVAPA